MTTAPAPAAGLIRANWLRLQRSLKARMVAAFLTVSVAIAVTTAFAVYRQASSALRASVSDRIKSLAERRAADVKRWVSLQQELLVYATEIPSVQADAATLAASPHDAAARQRLEAQLRSARAHGLAARSMELLQVPGGMVIASTDAGAVGTYRSSAPVYTEGMRGRYIENIYPSPVNARPTFSMSAPLRDGRGTPFAVLAVDLDLRQIDMLLAQASSGFPVRVYLVNKSAEQVSSERFGSAIYTRGLRSEGITNALAGHDSIHSYVDFSGRRVIGAYRWLPERELALMVEVPEADAFEPARELLVWVLVGGLFAGGALAMVVYLVTGRVAEPILTTARAARRIAAGDFSVRAPVTTQDEVGELASSFNDMTDRLRTLYDDLQGQVQATTSALEALRENQALMHGIVDNSATLVLVMSQSGRCILANHEFEGVFGVRREQLQGRLLLDAIPGEAAVSLMEATESVIQRGRAVEREFTAPSARGHRTYLAICFPILSPTGTPSAVGVIATDLTERKRAEAEQREFEKNVQHAQKLESLGVMAGGIAHDFNNLLGAVVGNADLALASLDDRAEVQRSIEQVLSAARRAADLTRQMLAYAGRASFRREASDVNALVREISGLAAMSLSKKAQLDLQLSATTPWVVADPAQLSQVVLNLLTNAGDAIGDATGRVTVRTEIVRALPPTLAERWMGEPPPNGPYVLLTVEDTGSGMDAETRARIFEPFFSTKALGRGLGLAAVLGIVKGIGGALTVVSAPGMGSRFDLAFAATAAPQTVETVEAPLDAPDAERRTVLVVDDEASLRSLARRGLHRAGFDVVEAVDGHEGVATFAARGRMISAVVLDLTMPGMSGHEVLTAIRAMDADVPVIITSGYARDHLETELRDDGALRWVQKPYSIQQLVQTVAEISRVAV